MSIAFSKRERVACHAMNAAVIAIVVGLVAGTWAAVCGAWLAYAVGFIVGGSVMMRSRP